MKISSRAILANIIGVALFTAFALGLEFDTIFGIEPINHTESKIRLLFPFILLVGALMALLGIYKKQKDKENANI
jgi:hypothetical protein